MSINSRRPSQNADMIARVTSLRVSRQLVSDPLQMWRLYARSYPRTIREYDFGAPGDPNLLTGAEAWRSRIINSRLSRSECDQVVSRALSAPWDSVPVWADLAHADPGEPGGLFVDAARLYWSFTWPERITGVSVAKVHKILHLKRPGLYPILDKRVKSLYRPSAAEWAPRLGHRGGATLADSPPYWAAFRDDLARNRDALHTFRAQMAENKDEVVRTMAKLTCLRLQDIIAWMVAVGMGGTTTA
jgi:hypothetical protein